MWITSREFQKKYNITPQCFYNWKKANKIKTKEETEDEQGHHEDERREGQDDVNLEQDDEAKDEHPEGIEDLRRLHDEEFANRVDVLSAGLDEVPGLGLLVIGERQGEEVVVHLVLHVAVDETRNASSQNHADHGNDDEDDGAAEHPKADEVRVLVKRFNVRGPRNDLSNPFLEESRLGELTHVRIDQNGGQERGKHGAKAHQKLEHVRKDINADVSTKHAFNGFPNVRHSASTIP